MQTFITEVRQSNIPKKIIKPNIHKVFVKNLITVSGIAALIILLLVYMDKIVGLDVFLMPFESLGITVQGENILMVSILIFLGLTVGILAVNYLNIINLKYELYDDHLRVYNSVAWLFMTNKEIPYNNILKMSYNYDGFMNKLLSCGDITIDLTGMKEGFVKLELLDRTEELMAELMKTINEYKSLQQMQFEENRKINNIMKKF
ncbi:MAG: hypothetical protein ACP5NW_05940 [Candidatus Woesearchaeota archaeon]